MGITGSRILEPTASRTCNNAKVYMTCLFLLWPGSFFNSKHGYCHPTGGKPAADFSIGGLWPYYIDGSFPLNCNPQIPYSQSKDLISRMQKSWPSLSCPSSNGSSLWAREWEQHGTCSQSVLDQHGYFESALKLKDKIKLLQVFQNAGI